MTDRQLNTGLFLSLLVLLSACVSNGPQTSEEDLVRTAMIEIALGATQTVLTQPSPTVFVCTDINVAFWGAKVELMIVDLPKQMEVIINLLVEASNGDDPSEKVRQALTSSEAMRANISGWRQDISEITPPQCLEEAQVYFVDSLNQVEQALLTLEAGNVDAFKDQVSIGLDSFAEAIGEMQANGLTYDP
jgi:Arc/MetJ-type ribon-helix-helix transcriptional regulator